VEIKSLRLHLTTGETVPTETPTEVIVPTETPTETAPGGI